MLYCDVALPVPLDLIFTYEAGDLEPIVGGRVVVPFGRGAEKKLSGIVTRVHHEPPAGRQLKRVARVLDSVPVLDRSCSRWGDGSRSTILRRSAKCIAPCCRCRPSSGRPSATGLPSLAPRRCTTWRARARRGAQQTDPEHQENEYAVLDELAEGDLVREERLRTATGATREVLRTLQHKKWIVREDLSGVRDARRLVKFVVSEVANCCSRKRRSDGGEEHPIRPATN